MKASDLFIYPRPRKAVLTKGECKVPAIVTAAGVDAEAVRVVFGIEASPADFGKAWIEIATGASLKGGAEAYKLSIAKDKIKIASPTRLGAIQGMRSVRQLMRQFPKALPCLEIEDWPEFPIRGAMLDISRDRVPRMGTLLEMIDKLSEMKLNHFQLYTEHTFAYAGHESVWRDASPMTADEMRALDAYCAARGVELCANQNCLGHMERWLKHEKYSQLGEMDFTYFADLWGGCLFEPNTVDPSNPETIALFRDILGQIVPTCSGRFVNIGCDEPVDLGNGKSKSLCEKKGRLTVYGEHVAKIASIVRDLGRRPQFWADPDFGRKRDELPELPKDLIGLVWGYEANMDFTPRVNCIVEAGMETWIAPGACGWGSYTGRTSVRRGNLDLAAKTRKLGTVGFLNTEWGDNGHRQQWPIDMLGLAEGAYVSWTGEPPKSAKAAGLHLFGDEKTGEWLEELGLADSHIPVGNSNASYRDSMAGFHEPPNLGTLKDWKLAKDKVKQLAKSAPSSDSLVARECRQALNALSWSVERAILRRSGKELAPEDRKLLIKSVIEVAREHRDLWLIRSRPGGLVDSLAHYKLRMKSL